MSNKTRRFRSLHLLTVVAMVAGQAVVVLAISPTVASAAIGASSVPLTTAAPDLRTVTVVDVSLARARFCFDQSVAGFAALFAKFHLLGYDSVVTTAGTSIGADSDPNCVLVDFAGSKSDISQYTVGTVDPGAVQNAALTNSNVESAAALTNISLGAGGIGGGTSGPDLVSAATDVSITNDVLYTYDEKLDTTPASCDMTKFGFWTAAGTRTTGATNCSISAGSPTVARVSFTSTTGAVRFFALTAAVKDRGGDAAVGQASSPLGSTSIPISCTPGPSNCTADLTGVNRVDATHVDYTLDAGGEPTGASGCVATDYFVFGEDATLYTASACDVRSSSASSSVVRATFSTTNFSPFETPTAGLATAALTGSGAPASTTEGALPLGTSQEASGFSDAPDLLTADFDTSFFRVTYNFDENVNPTSVTTPADYCVVDANDVETCASASPVSVTGNQVVMSLPSAAINTAVGAVVLAGAAKDYGGNTSVEASVGRGAPPAAGTVQLSSSSYSVAESAGSVTITATRTGGTSGSATVNFSTTNGSATAGTDYSTTNGNLTWADAEGGSKSFSVPILDDGNLAEGNQAFTVSLSPASGTTLGSPSSASVTIQETDTGSVQFSSSTSSVGENGGSVTLLVTRSGGSSGAASVSFNTSDGTATAGSDYTANSGSLFWADGDGSTKTIVVHITQDNPTEGEQDTAFTVHLFSASGAFLGSPTTNTVTIVDDDTSSPGSLQFDSASYSVNETAGTMTITVTRLGGSNGAVTVNYATSNGSATVGKDYTSSSGTRSFATGEVAKTFVVPITDDNKAGESTQTVNLTLSSPTGGATLGTPSTAVLSIAEDNDPSVRHIATGATINFQPKAGSFRVQVYFPNGENGPGAARCRSDREVVLHRPSGAPIYPSAFTGQGGGVFFGGYSHPASGYFAVVKAATRFLSDGTTVMCARGVSNLT